FAAEHPEKFEELWQRMPEYIEKGSKFVDMASTFLERMGQEKGGYRNMPAASGTRFWSRNIETRRAGSMPGLLVFEGNRPRAPGVFFRFQRDSLAFGFVDPQR